MTIYVDILFLNNTFMTYAIIWSVARILGYKTKWWRLLLAAFFGTMYTLIIIYTKTIYWPSFYTVIGHIILNIITAVIIIFISFGKLSLKKFIKAAGYLYLISFMCTGTILSIISIFGLDQIYNNKKYIFLTLAVLILVYLGNAGWKIFHSYKLPENLIIPVHIYYQNDSVKVKGLIDTGNSLKDPITNVPVIITEYRYALNLFPPEINKYIKKDKGGIIKLVDVFAENNMGDRVRILPFSDLGQEHGMLVGFRPDKVEIIYKGNKILKEKILLALTDRILDEEDHYRALVNPRILS